MSAPSVDDIQSRLFTLNAGYSTSVRALNLFSYNTTLQIFISRASAWGAKVLGATVHMTDHWDFRPTRLSYEIFLSRPLLVIEGGISV